MQAFYVRLVDKFVHPELEKRFRLGRRRVEDRRLLNKDRRSAADENFRYSESERRNSDTIRRDPEMDERRQRWFRINAFQSRHLV